MSTPMPCLSLNVILPKIWGCTATLHKYVMRKEQRMTVMSLWYTFSHLCFFKLYIFMFTELVYKKFITRVNFGKKKEKRNTTDLYNVYKYIKQFDSAT